MRRIHVSCTQGWGVETASGGLAPRAYASVWRPEVMGWLRPEGWLVPHHRTLCQHRPHVQTVLTRMSRPLSPGRGEDIAVHAVEERRLPLGVLGWIGRAAAVVPRRVLWGTSRDRPGCARPYEAPGTRRRRPPHPRRRCGGLGTASKAGTCSVWRRIRSGRRGLRRTRRRGPHLLGARPYTGLSVSMRSSPSPGCTLR